MPTYNRALLNGPKELVGSYKVRGVRWRVWLVWIDAVIPGYLHESCSGDGTVLLKRSPFPL